MQRPTGIAVSEDGKIAIADYDNRVVSLYDAAGKYINRIGSGKLLGKHPNNSLAYYAHFYKNMVN